jgi:hypothetical protein
MNVTLPASSFYFKKFPTKVKYSYRLLNFKVEDTFRACQNQLCMLRKMRTTFFLLPLSRSVISLQVMMQ